MNSAEDIALMFAKVRDAAKLQDHADVKAKTRLVKQAQQFPTEIPQETMLESYRNKLDPSLRVPGHIYSRWDQKFKQGLAQFTDTDRKEVLSALTSSTPKSLQARPISFSYCQGI